MIQVRVDSLESQLKASRFDQGVHTDRNRDSNMVSQRERERLADSKSIVRSCVSKE